MLEWKRGQRLSAEHSRSMDMGARRTATVYGRQAQFALALYPRCLPLTLPAFILSHCFFRLEKEQAKCMLAHAVVCKQSCKNDYFHVTSDELIMNTLGGLLCGEKKIFTVSTDN